jgi:tRNA(Ile)-lysidine synthase
MEKELNSCAVEHISDTMEDFLEIQEYIEAELERIEKDCVIYEEGMVHILEEAYRKQPKALQHRLLKRCLIHVAGRQRDIGRVHVQALENLMDLQCGRELDLPYQVCAQREYQGICLQQKGAPNPSKSVQSQKLPVELPIPCEEGRIRTRVFPKDANTNILEKTHTKWFDYDIIKGTLQIRNRKSGDYLVVDRAGSRQKLKSYFVNAKIPKEERDRLLLVADGSHILWVIGYRMSMAYQVTEKTRRILEVQIAEDCENV